jgi:hypothetical protein
VAKCIKKKRDFAHSSVPAEHSNSFQCIREEDSWNSSPFPRSP